MYSWGVKKKKENLTLAEEPVQTSRDRIDPPVRTRIWMSHHSDGGLSYCLLSDHTHFRNLPSCDPTCATSAGRHSLPSSIGALTSDSETWVCRQHARVQTHATRLGRVPAPILPGSNWWPTRCIRDTLLRINMILLFGALAPGRFSGVFSWGCTATIL